MPLVAFGFFFLMVSQLVVGVSAAQARNQFKNESWYEKAVEFTDQWDQAAFDPDYEVDSLDSFKPLINKFFEVPQKLI